MKKYDDIVVGSGVSGLTLTLFLAMNGRRVLLLEKSPRIGGSLSVFARDGVHFDTGFHFTGGLQKGGLLHEMLSALGMYELIRPVFLPEENANSFFIESEHRFYEIPYGFPRMREKFKAYFPSEAAAIDRYFDKVLHVCANTPSMDLRMLPDVPFCIAEDFVTLRDVLDELTRDRVLKALLSGFAMCYGVKPGEISFANHSRICAGIYESVSRIAGGGAALIEVFERRFSEYDVEVSRGNFIVEMAGIRDQKVGRFVLNDGEEVECENCVLTIHPKEILKLIPEDLLSRAFRNRVSSYESSIGFFALFGTLGCDDDESESIVSIFPHPDIDLLLDPGYTESSALVLIKSTEEVNGKRIRVLNTLETSSLQHVAQWKDSTRGRRPEEYYDYKRKRSERIRERIFRVFPAYRERLRVIDTGSVLTFRDYLHSPDGSAYGVKQKIGQYNLFGRLPLRNLYAAGQSSLLPGIMGAMMSSFIVGRTIIKEEKYQRFVSPRLCH